MSTASSSPCLQLVAAHLLASHVACFVQQVRQLVAPIFGAAYGPSSSLSPSFTAQASLQSLRPVASGASHGSTDLLCSASFLLSFRIS
jgi:hypothetical protein